LLPSIVSEADRAQILHDARESLDWRSPPKDVIEKYQERSGLPERAAYNNVRKMWLKMLKIAAIRREFLPVLEAAKRAATSAKGDIAVRSVWNYSVLSVLMQSEDERNIIVMLESLRRANGHDATTVKHERALPDMDTVRKWKQEMLDAGISEFEKVDLSNVKAADAVVVQNNGTQPGHA
jgi:hypothetical protein